MASYILAMLGYFWTHSLANFRILNHRYYEWWWFLIKYFIRCRPSNSEFSSWRQSNAFSSSGKIQITKAWIKGFATIHYSFLVVQANFTSKQRWILNPYLSFIRELNKYNSFIDVTLGGKALKQSLTLKQRRDLSTRMSKVFGQNIKALSAELQAILLDDLVTAFQNRINVLMRAQEKRSY